MPKRKNELMRMMKFSNSMICGGLLYGKLAIFIHFLISAEPGLKLVFNLTLSMAAIIIGLVAKAKERSLEMKERAAEN